MTRTTYFNLLLILGALFTSNCLSAQEENKTPKNSIYASIGTVFFVNQYSVSYERVLAPIGNGTLSGKLNFGNHTSNSLDLDTGARITDKHFSLSGVYRLKILELTLGAAYETFTLAEGFDEPDPDIDYALLRNRVAPYVTAGIRYDAGPLVLRAGLGNYELLYAGIGFTF
jgi:hypothetical protein